MHVRGQNSMVVTLFYPFMINLPSFESCVSLHNRALKKIATKLAGLTFDDVYCNIIYVNYKKSDVDL